MAKWTEIHDKISGGVMWCLSVGKYVVYLRKDLEWQMQLYPVEASEHSFECRSDDLHEVMDTALQCAARLASQESERLRVFANEISNIRKLRDVYDKSIQDKNAARLELLEEKVQNLAEAQRGFNREVELRLHEVEGKVGRRQSDCGTYRA